MANLALLSVFSMMIGTAAVALALLVEGIIRITTRAKPSAPATVDAAT